MCWAHDSTHYVSTGQPGGAACPLPLLYPQLCAGCASLSPSPDLWAGGSEKGLAGVRGQEQRARLSLPPLARGLSIPETLGWTSVDVIPCSFRLLLQLLVNSHGMGAAVSESRERGP